MVDATWETSKCWKCQEPMAFQAGRIDHARKSESPLHCPFGHPNYWKLGKTESDKLRDQLDEERRQRQQAEQAVAREADWRREAEEKAKHERNRANGYKGHATRITKRAKAGVCPCCNRTFQQLARHMQTQHPTFTPMALEVIEGGKAVAHAG